MSLCLIGYRRISPPRVTHTKTNKLVGRALHAACVRNCGEPHRSRKKKENCVERKKKENCVGTKRLQIIAQQRALENWEQTESKPTNNPTTGCHFFFLNWIQFKLNKCYHQEVSSVYHQFVDLNFWVSRVNYRMVSFRDKEWRKWKMVSREIKTQ